VNKPDPALAARRVEDMSDQELIEAWIALRRLAELADPAEARRVIGAE
jgi:hypothetical protein